MSAITIDDDLVHYEVLGRGKPVILLHGWLGSWRYWVPTMQQLAVRYRCYALDMWGFGDSAKDPRRYSLERQLELIDKFLIRMGIKKMVMVGHGLGALLAARYAIDPFTAPKIHRLLVVSPPLYEGAPSMRPAPKPTALPAPASSDQTIPSRAAFLQSLQNDSTQPIPAPLRAALQGENLNSNPLRQTFAQYRYPYDDVLRQATAPNSVDFEKLKAEIAKAPDEAILASANLVSTTNTLHDLESTQTMTCVLVGEQDRLVQRPNRQVIDRLESNEHVKVITLANTYHFPMLEENSQFVRLVKEFLEAPSFASLEMKEEWRRRNR